MIGLFGTGRNGSSLLLDLLDGSPDLWIHPVETRYLTVFSDLVEFGKVREDTVKNARTRPVRVEQPVPGTLLRPEFSRHTEYLQDQLLPGVEDAPTDMGDPRNEIDWTRSWRSAELLPRLLSAYRRRLDANPETEKELLYKSIETPYIGDYERAFPRMRFLHLLRHPVDTYASLKRTNMLRKGWPFWRHGGDQLRMFLEDRWLPHARFLRERIDGNDDDHHLVCYEDLTEDPDRTLAEIFRWLGAASGPESDRRTLLGGLRARRLPQNTSGGSGQTPQRVVRDLARRQRYEEVVSPREEDFILLRTRPYLEMLGYENDRARSVDPDELASRWRWPGRWEFRNAWKNPVRLPVALFHRRRYLWEKLSQSSG